MNHTFATLSVLPSYSTPVARPVTRAMIYSRTLELATSEGRSPRHIRQMDYERAKRELTGESDYDKQQARLDCNESY